MTLRIHDDVDVGVATHCGQVRTANEDDYLVVEPGSRERIRRGGRLFIVADGMGGVSGGAEASRAAVRALAAAFSAVGEEVPPARLRGGFEDACRAVSALGREDPRLSEMGTTLTALLLAGRRGWIAHVGDSRCFRQRSGRLEQLTVDHALDEPRNLLTRCIGAGQDSEQVDEVEVDVSAGDVFLLCTDGVWNTVRDGEIASILRSASALRAADRLIERANQRGAPDNCTAVVVRVLGVDGPSGDPRPVDLPAAERALVVEAGRPPRLGAPRWPWVAIAVSVVVIVVALLRLLLGVDLLGLVRGL